MNPFNQMFNNEYIQQQAARAHEQQIENVLKSAQKLKDFFESTKDIEPEYQGQALALFCSIVNDYTKNKGNVNA